MSSVGTQRSLTWALLMGNVRVEVEVEHPGDPQAPKNHD